MSLLRGRTALITGGGRGIGLAIAKAFAREQADLFLVARTLAELEAAAEGIRREYGVRCSAFRADVSKPGEVAAMTRACVSELGRVDILVNNAGVYGPIGELVENDLEEWRQAIEVNLLGAVYATRAVLPAMRAQGGGCILNLAGAGIGGPAVTPRISAYATSKAAIVQFTESISREAAAWNVQVNAIAPGAVTTEITNAVIAAGPEKAGRDFYERNVKQKEKGGDSPELAANLAVLLASGRTGQLTGKLLSAKWDKLEKLDPAAANQSSLYALRRIDGVLFGEVPKV
jgi:NAD(P)-dependent dehydrogenase (short-subunit alcohol dehydrogenase family)